MRFSILGLLGLVAYAGMACFAVLHPSKAVAGGITAAMLALLAAAVILAAYSFPGRRRAYWVGFAIALWTVE